MHNRARKLPILTALAVLTIGSAAPVQADSIALVNGSIFYSRQNAAQFIAGSPDGHLINSDFGNFALEVWNPDHACFDCIPGTTIALSQSESFATGDDEMGVSGAVRIGGVDYWVQTLAFEIDAGSFALPDSSNMSIFLTSPFAFRGAITGRTDAGVVQTFNFGGTGSATAQFFDNDWFGTTYAFAAATPEPGTLLLIGGPALLALRRRRSLLDRAK